MKNETKRNERNEKKIKYYHKNMHHNNYMYNTINIELHGQLTGPRMSHHLDTAPIAGHQRRLVSGQGCIVEGVLASCVRPRVTFITVYGPS